MADRRKVKYGHLYEGYVKLIVMQTEDFSLL